MELKHKFVNQVNLKFMYIFLQYAVSMNSLEVLGMLGISIHFCHHNKLYVSFCLSQILGTTLNDVTVQICFIWASPIGAFYKILRLFTWLLRFQLHVSPQRKERHGPIESPQSHRSLAQLYFLVEKKPSKPGHTWSRNAMDFISWWKCQEICTRAETSRSRWQKVEGTG